VKRGGIILAGGRGPEKQTFVHQTIIENALFPSVRVGPTLCAGIKFMLIEIYVRWPQLKLKQTKFNKKKCKTGFGKWQTFPDMGFQPG